MKPAREQKWRLHFEIERNNEYVRMHNIICILYIHILVFLLPNKDSNGLKWIGMKSHEIERKRKIDAE